MTWKDVTREPAPGTVVWFGVLLGGLMAAWGYHLGWNEGRRWPAMGWMAAGVGCAVAGWRATRWFRWVYTGAMAVAFPIGWVVSQGMLLVFFYGVFFPVGLVMRWRGRDPIDRKRRPSGASYWEPKRMPTDMRRYLRQY